MTVDEFIAKWQPSGGSERANSHLFITDLCALLEIEAPQPTLSDDARNDYVFERHVVKTEIDGAVSNGWIDCYKRDSFILEAKQGSDADIRAVDAGQGDSLRDFFGQTAADRYKRGMAKRGTGQWTGAMQRAAGQAEGYAKALPADHGWPPFLLVSDIGYCIDVYADFQRNGKGYAPFPDRRRFRITLEDLRDEKVRKRLADVWQRPMALDPSAEAAKVTREIAELLAEVAKRLEKEHHPDKVAEFLMRLLFTMFAEDVGFGDKTLLPKGSFTAFLKRQAERPDLLPHQLSLLWAAMDKGGIAGMLGDAGESVREFNGYLFKDRTALPLTAVEIGALIKAAEKDWKDVEPAIFGTLLERALNPNERAKLGAHYTPRAYVERLVGPTIMEPLREDWLGARTAATEAAEAGDKEKARKLVEEFHGKLARTTVLDPACGTGNFLYVAMARMKELEGEVLELLQELGDVQYLAEISGHTITPENFLGIEINPRAAAIAQLVLWIGYLQWHFRVNREDRMPATPVLRDVKTIQEADALLEWDDQVLVRDDRGKPISIWDGSSMKKHAITGRLVPDESQRREVFRYVNPRRRAWPKADFIIGNPPFIGSKRMRKRLGSPYVDALRTVYHDVPGEIDFVTYWWARSAELTVNEQVRSFGLITTKTIAQSSNRPVLRRYLDMQGGGTLRLSFAIPNHPWHDTETTASVRIAMTSCVKGEGVGRLSVVKSARRKKGQTLLEFEDHTAPINVDLTIGPNVAAAKRLKANSGICWMGVKMSGEGFKFGALDRERFLTAGVPGDRMPMVIAGADVTERQSETFAFDFFDIGSQSELADQYPVAFQHLYDHVKPERDQNDREQYRRNWWRFAETRPRLRSSIRGLRRYIVTSETSSNRFFKFVRATGALADGSVIVIASEDAHMLGLVSSRAHELWAIRAGGRMGVGDDPRYQNEVCFDPFPFPPADNANLFRRIKIAARKLDRLRRKVLTRHEDLTLTKLYNTVEALRAAQRGGTVLSPDDRDIAERGCVSLILQYHDEIDAAVFEAYGWPPALSDEEILERLVALNKQRVAEEVTGNIRWLRPDFQKPGYVAPAQQVPLALPEKEKAAEAIQWPSRLPEQVVAVSGIVERAGKPVAANDVARAFKGKRAATVLPVLDALAGMGRVRKLEDGRYAA